jgi:hypothetical protein
MIDMRGNPANREPVTKREKELSLAAPKERPSSRIENPFLLPD